MKKQNDQTKEEDDYSGAWLLTGILFCLWLFIILFEDKDEPEILT
jgi:hypothetical protein